MKISKLNYEILVVIGSLLLVCILTAFGVSHIKGGTKDLNFEIPVPAAEFENFDGSSEFFLKPAGDQRMWHISNKYVIADSDSGFDCNNSEYLFTADSVRVRNTIIVPLEVY
ncbi:MAG: hypothetical protein L0Y79_11375 [Chlorobi bacterium]|nr:hypothetical protein [Chlorobiota bacterium]MCI0714746.1 hypothetical protein [Chlorobiota bacterium]